MNVMVLGAGGMIGRAVGLALVARGHRVVSVTRAGAVPSGGHQTHCLADRADPESIRSLIKSHHIDALVDMVAYTAIETRALLDAVADKVSRYLLISSADVYRNYGLLHRRETGKPDPGLLVEDAPLRTTRFPYRGPALRHSADPARWMDDYDKIPVEDAVCRQAPNATILRLPMVFGARDRQAPFRWALAPILAGTERVDIPQAWLAWTTTYGHVSNVSDAIAHAVASPQTQRRTFNITDFPPVSHRDWFERFASAAGWRGAVVETVDPVHPIAQATAGLDLEVGLRVSGAAFAEACKWTPPLSVDEIAAR